MTGFITQVIRRQRCGFIRSQEGDEFYFRSEDVDLGEAVGLRVGEAVEFDVQYGFERPHAVNIQKLQGRGGPRTLRPQLR